MTNRETVSVLRLTLHGATVGFLAGYQGGRNVLTFDPTFRENDRRPTSRTTPWSIVLALNPFPLRQRRPASSFLSPGSRASSRCVSATGPITCRRTASWAKRADIPWRAIKPHLEDSIDKARTLWPRQLTTLPMTAEHKKILIAHWGQLRADFQIRSEIE
jgi:hypothetical protein